MIKVNNRWLYCGLSFFVLALLFAGGDAKLETIHEDVCSPCSTSDVEPRIPSSTSDLGKWQPSAEGPLADLNDIVGLDTDWIQLLFDDFADIEHIDPSLPVVTLLGVTGSGKSTLGNMLARVGDPNRKELFETSGRMESCTTTVDTAGITDFAGRPMLIIDTPGLADTKGRDAEIRQDVVNFLMRLKVCKETFGVNTFAMVLNNGKTRLDDQDQEIIAYYARMFGAEFLDNLVFVVRSWPYAKSDIKDIKRSSDPVDKRLPYGEEGKQRVSNDIKEMVHKRLQQEKNARYEQRKFDISEERLEKILAEGFPCFCIDSQWDKKSWGGEDFVYTEEERQPAKAEVERLLNHIQSSPKYPCLPWYMNPNVQSNVAFIEEQKALTEQSLEDGKQEKKKIAEVHQDNVERQRNQDREDQDAANKKFADNQAREAKIQKDQKDVDAAEKRQTEEAERVGRRQAAVRKQEEENAKKDKELRENRADELLSWGKQMRDGGIAGTVFSVVTLWSGVTGAVYLARGLRMIELSKKVRSGEVPLTRVQEKINAFW